MNLSVSCVIEEKELLRFNYMSYDKIWDLKLTSMKCSDFLIRQKTIYLYRWSFSATHHRHFAPIRCFRRLREWPSNQEGFWGGQFDNSTNIVERDCWRGLSCRGFARCCTRNQNLDIVDHLLKIGADPNFEHGRCVKEATQQGNV